MDNDQITALAREYAEEKGKKMEREQSLPNCLIKEVMEMDAKELTNFLQWLLRRFCIVEKERVKDEYNNTLEEAKHSHPKHQIQSRTRMRLLKSLFPEIAKEGEG